MIKPLQLVSYEAHINDKYFIKYVSAPTFFDYCSDPALLQKIEGALPIYFPRKHPFAPYFSRKLAALHYFPGSPLPHCGPDQTRM